MIGRDRVATSDSGGRFIVQLPAGTYSLVIRGPGLVPDQRVDEVAVVPGRLLDLGVVEVWPDERPPQCTPARRSAPGADPTSRPRRTRRPSTSPARGCRRSARIAGPGSAARIAGDRARPVRAAGKPLREDEDALGPPSFAVGPQGGLFVLDALNGRVQRFDPARAFAAAFP